MQVIYAVPSDREENTRYAAVVRDAILHVQDWYAEQLDGLTFAIEDPTPLICAVEDPAEYYEGEHGWNRVIESVRHCAPVQHWSDEMCGRSTSTRNSIARGTESSAGVPPASPSSTEATSRGLPTRILSRSVQAPRHVAPLAGLAD